jgi:hypothetical protein
VGTEAPRRIGENHNLFWLEVAVVHFHLKGKPLCTYLIERTSKALQVFA